MNDINSARGFLESVAGYVNQPVTQLVGSQDRAIKIGTIDSAYTGTGKPKVKFDGESTTSGKQYTFLDSYVPVAGERVLLLPAGNSYVIVGGIASTAVAGSGGDLSTATGTLAVAHGGTGATTLTGLLKGNGTAAITAATAGTDYVAPSGSITGNAATATKLTTARSIQTNLGSAVGVNFDGTAGITPGVTGTLPTGNGGTGRTDGLAVNVTGTVATANGGTGRTDGLAVNVTGTVAVANGGTGTTNAAQAKINLGIQTIADIPWTNLTYATGFTAGTATQLMYCVQNGVVYIKGGATGTFATGAYTQVNSGLLPTALRPAVNSIRSGAMGTGMKPAGYEINPAGTILLGWSDWGNTNTSTVWVAPTWIGFNCAYPVGS
jgi:hypothetical protein